MNAFFAAVGRFSVRFRWLVLVVWIGGTAAAVAFLPSLASVAQNNNTDFLPAGAPSVHAAQLAAPFQQANVTPIPVVVARPDGTLTTQDEAAIAQLQQALPHVSGVTAVRDLGRSPDGHAEQIQALVQGAQGDPASTKTLVTDLRAAVSHVAMPAGLQAHLAGGIATMVDSNAQSGASSDQIQNLSVVFIIVLLLIIFRSVLAPLVTLAPAMLVVALAGPLIAEASHAGLKVSGLAQAMLIVLVLGAGTDYGLFLVFRVREQMRDGLAPKDAVVAGVTTVGESITFSAGTVIAALLSLLASTFGIYADLGAPLAIGIGLMLLAGLTLLPAMLAILGRAVFWPSRTRTGPARTGLWGRVSAGIVRRPLITLIVGVLAFGGLAVASIDYEPAGFGGDTSAPKDSDSAEGNDLLAAHFPTSSANPTSIIFQLATPAWDDPGVLATAQQQLQADTALTGVTGPLNPNGVPITPADLARLHRDLGPARALPAAPPPELGVPPAAYRAYRATAAYLSPDGRTVQYAVGLTAGDPTGTSAIRAVPGIRADVDRIAGAIGATDHGVAGQAAALYDVSSTSTRDLRTVVPIAIAIIAVLLGLVMRSLVAPFYLIISVALSYLAALGLAVIVFTKIGHDQGLTFILPFLMFLFLLALGEDYNILVMTRIREEAHRVPLREAVSRALAATGTTVTSAGLVLAGTFAVFAVAGSRSGGSQLRDIGVGVAVGVLMDTFLVRTVLVPSTVVLLGRWNWWPARLGRIEQPIPAVPVADAVTDSDSAADAVPAAPREPGLVTGEPAAVELAADSPAGSAITGTVRGEGGAGVADAVVILADHTGNQVDRATATEQGGFTFAGLPAGMYTLIVMAAGFQPHAATVVLADGRSAGHDLLLRSDGVVTGTVRSGAGGPGLAAATVVAIDGDGRVVGRTTTVEDGAFRLSGLPEGGVVLTGSAPGHQPTAVTTKLVAGRVLTVELALTAVGSVHGVVSAVGGPSLAGATVTVIDTAGEVVASATTDVSGRYRFDELPVGEYVTVTALSQPAAVPVSIGPGTHVTLDVVLGLAPGGQADPHRDQQWPAPSELELTSLDG